MEEKKLESTLAAGPAVGSVAEEPALAALLEKAAALGPCKRSMAQLEAHMQALGAVPYAMSELDRRTLLGNIVLAFFPERVPLDEQGLPDFFAASELSPQELGLSFGGYRFPGREGRVLLERRTETVTTHGAGPWEDLLEELLLYQGVTEEDIARRTPRFVAYAQAMHRQGRL